MKQIACAILTMLLLPPMAYGSDLKSENAALKRQIRESQIQIHALEEQIQQLQSQIGALESAPRKLLARAKSLQQQKQYERARLLYSNIVSLYPLESPEVKEAMQQVDELDRILRDIAQNERDTAQEKKETEEWRQYSQVEKKNSIDVSQAIEKLPSFGIVKGTGVRLRKGPSLREEVVGFIGKADQTSTHYSSYEHKFYEGELVVLIERSEHQTEIDGHKDYWYKIRAITEEWRYDKEGWCYGKFVTIHNHMQKQGRMLYQIREIGFDIVKIDFGLAVTDQSPQQITVIGTRGSLIADLHNLALDKGVMGELLDPAAPSYADDVEFAKLVGGADTHPIGVYRFGGEAKDIGEPLFAIEGQHFPMDFATVHKTKETRSDSEVKEWFGPFVRLTRYYSEVPGQTAGAALDIVLFDESRRRLIRSIHDYIAPFIRIPLSFQMGGRKFYVVEYTTKGDSHIGIMCFEGGRWRIATPFKGYPTLC